MSHSVSQLDSGSEEGEGGGGGFKKKKKIKKRKKKMKVDWLLNKKQTKTHRRTHARARTHLKLTKRNQTIKHFSHGDCVQSPIYYW